MNRLTPYVLSVLLLLLLSSPSYSQVDSVKFNHLGLDDGLSQVTVTSILQDDKGLLWFGTVGGLNRYDGQNMLIYRSDLTDPNTLSNQQITDMCKDPDGNFWIGSSNGISFFNLKTEQFLRYSDEYGPGQVSHNEINSIYCDADGTVWAATDRGLNSLKNKQEGFNRQYFAPEGTEEMNDFQAVYRDRAGRLWVGSFGAGLYYLDSETDKLVQSPISKLQDKVVNAIYEDRQGYLWVGTNNGVIRINEDETTVKIFKNIRGESTSLSDNTVNVIYQDSRKNIWVGTENGLNLFHPQSGNFSRFNNDPKDEQSIGSNRVHSIYEDNHNTLWIGTWTGGLSKFSYHRKNLKHYLYTPNDPNSLSDNSILDFYEGADNNIWIATDKGLNQFDPKTKKFSHYFNEQGDPNTLSSNRIYNIEQDQNKDLWVSTANGLNHFDPQSGDNKRYYHEPGNPNSLSYNALWGLDIDHKGHVWIATRGGGLDVLNPETNTFKHYNHDPNNPQSISGAFVSDVYVDSKGQVWIGTRGGLDLYQPETDSFKKFPRSSDNPHSLDDNMVMDFYEDSKGRLWVGSMMGVTVLDIETHEVLQYFSRKDGLPDDTIWGITEDENGTIYLTTTFGLAVWNAENETFDLFDKRDGLQANEFNAGAALTASDGKIYIGGINGFNTFYPSDLEGNPHPPPVVITEFQLYNEKVPVRDTANADETYGDILTKSITYTDTLTLSHADDVFSFEFAALNYTIPEKNKYAYKMVGFEEDWNYVGSRNFATYTNLPPGEYTFRVKAANSDGVWNEEGTALTINIMPPFWQTTWFYLFASVFIIGIVFTGYKIKVRRYKEYSERLEQEVADRTSELNNRNEELKNALEELEKARDEVVEKAHKAGMADLATGILHNVGNILNSVNTSAALIEDTMKHSKLQGLLQANNVLREHVEDIEDFVANNPKGKKLMQYYLKLEEPLKKEQRKVIKQSKRLTEKIELINEAIAAQQSYAGASMYADHISLGEMIQDALTLQAGSIDRHGLTVDKDLESVDPIIAQHSKLMHVLVNLIKNAKEAMAGNRPDNKVLNIKSWQDDDRVFLSISDNGSGIKDVNLKKVFNHGFTTKKSGHGFGLHSCANYMKEMGGDIEVESEGKGQGATFTLVFSKAEDNKDEEK
ncbi:two-component regulator propeller domain-containing protein [Fodinibius saliphilus]|uniref:two-component regulator propeller domain-containing protein n=1 Tax=Fodinibius saliphilus TaxID=1920650 RepID=UPI001108EEA7|nr:two-component regulator propeller domain-containing protein [Fodinibius saliphilus]